ncbi:putative allantoinase 1 [Cytospora mali]|uniref:Allantoinase 1 n=1 Tax=Cytospora mali TaxID=578113 RepID=A0A194VNR5_CYTMA|nr:putative allantoinase 1 [Valsa mali]
MTPTLPDVTTLATLPETTITAILDLLFEPSKDLHTLAVPTLRSITFSSYPELIDTIRDQLLAILDNVHSSPKDCQPLLSVLGSHPRLGEKKVESAQSAAEQAQLKKGPKGEAERLAALNKEYEEKFPGLRYVVFVNGRCRDVIMEDMRRRIDRADFVAEEKEAINAMADIAKDRAGKLEKESEESTVGRSALPEGS